MKRYKKRISRIAPCLCAAVTMTAVMFTGCGDYTYANQTTSAEFSGTVSAAAISNGFYTIEVSSFLDPSGERMALDTENGTYQTGCALPVAVSDSSKGQQFLVIDKILSEGLLIPQVAFPDAFFRLAHREPHLVLFGFQYTICSPAGQVKRAAAFRGSPKGLPLL